MKRICKQCGKEFELSQSEIKFYESKNLNIPKRCKECRSRNKQKSQEEKGMLEYTMPKKREGQPINKKDNRLLRSVVIAILLLVGAASVLLSDFKDRNNESTNIDYTDNITSDKGFRNEELLNEHYQKHGIEMGFASASDYEAAAKRVVENTKALHKKEAEDGDDVYYLENSNEFVIVSTDGYIRTYFKPNDGIAYYNRQ